VIISKFDYEIIVMIKANELRLGSWVNDAGVNIKVDKSYMSYLLDYPNNKRTKPIPLTPEILEKLGFVYRQDTGYWKIHDLIFGRDIKPYFSLYLKMRVATSIQYLHQLQNLYFALTGEELEVKLTEPVTL
jgi:hypothetical protein